MPGLGRSRWNEMDVDVQEPVVGKGFQIACGETGLFFDLAQRDESRVQLSLAVTARLQPAVELAVVEKQDAAARRIKDEAAAGQVPERLRPQVGVARMVAEELADEGHVARLLLVRAGVRCQVPIDGRERVVHIHGPRTLPEPVDCAQKISSSAAKSVRAAVENLCLIRHKKRVLTSIYHDASRHLPRGFTGPLALLSDPADKLLQRPDEGGS
jgi:hypothetical protein